jgi:hypothetical protein
MFPDITYQNLFAVIVLTLDVKLSNEDVPETTCYRRFSLIGVFVDPRCTPSSLLLQERWVTGAILWNTIRHPDIRVKHCACGHIVGTLLNPRGVTTVSHKYSLTVARHATVLVAVPSTVHYPANYKIKTLFHMKFKSTNKLYAYNIYYKLLKVPSYETKSYLLQLSVL